MNHYSLMLEQRAEEVLMPCLHWSTSNHSEKMTFAYVPYQQVMARKALLQSSRISLQLLLNTIQHKMDGT